ncbi:hypothetical protein [Halococcus saccharolyticus]|nr:hypothetical protein [Halococcus saccharolyticus]
MMPTSLQRTRDECPDCGGSTNVCRLRDLVTPETKTVTYCEDGCTWTEAA